MKEDIDTEEEGKKRRVNMEKIYRKHEKKSGWPFKEVACVQCFIFACVITCHALHFCLNKCSFHSRDCMV